MVDEQTIRFITEASNGNVGEVLQIVITFISYIRKKLWQSLEKELGKELVRY
jgi:DNA-directed RNA polymerase specialized sigma subunit